MCDVVNLFLLLICFHVTYNKEIIVTRTKDNDNFTPLYCSNTCSRYSNTFCAKTLGECCDRCKCSYGNSFTIQNGFLMCSRNPGHDHGCYYHFKESQDPNKPLHYQQLKRNSPTTVGVIVVKLSNNVKSLKNCAIMQDKSHYLNLMDWSPLFTNNRKPTDFYFSVKKKETVLVMNGVSSMYEGLLIKLVIRCEDENGLKKESCLMFKTLGTATHQFGTNPITTIGPSIVSPAITSILSPATTSIFSPAITTSLPETSHEKHHLTIIIIFVVLFIVLVIVAIILYCCWRRRQRRLSRKSFIRNTTQQSRKLLLQKSMDETELVYQAPENIGGNVSTSKEYGNPTYLQPVDNRKSKGNSLPAASNGNVNRSDKKTKSGKDASYDYPQLQITPMDKEAKKLKGNAAPDKHHYADIRVDETNSSTHHYIDPDKAKANNSAHHYIDPDKAKENSSAHHYIDPDKAKENDSANHYMDPDKKISPAYHYIDPDACMEKFLQNKAQNDGNCVRDRPKNDSGYADLTVSPVNTEYAALDGTQQPVGETGHTDIKSRKYYELEEDVPI